MNLIDMFLIKLLFLFHCTRYADGVYGNPLNKYIQHYEGLSYDTEALHSKHQRAKRALSHEDKFVHLDFHAHGRFFNLRMKRDTSLFSSDLKVEMSGEEMPYDTSHIYTGDIFGEKGSLSHGSIVDGKFEGFIQTHKGTYYVEPTERYLKDRDVPYHSVIYHEDDIVYPHKYGPEGGCADHAVFERMKKYQASAVEQPNKETNEVLEEEEEPSDGPVLLRKRRAAQVEKNTCQLFIQTDHLFFKYYGTREAVIAQISSHVKAIDSIYQSTDFMGIRNISFMVKRIRINSTSEERNKSNPFRFANIGVEKFLELNSEQNHDDYCLAYVFTDRDFDDGVLGLAWVGAAAEATWLKAHFWAYEGPKAGSYKTYEGPKAGSYKTYEGPKAGSYKTYEGPKAGSYKTYEGPKAGSYKTYEGPKAGSYKTYEGPKAGSYKTYEGPKAGSYKTYEGPKAGSYKTYEGPKAGSYKTYEGPKAGSYKAYEGPKAGSYKAYEGPVSRRPFLSSKRGGRPSLHHVRSCRAVRG
ncbi:hypothetical protein COCON_G00112390 [Conger conger]|uniref:Peptidase M12B domain-containing protein n=1 Tax=Conger conger TaxID=82655 RepID=A0A9Q1DJZ2_CONCO|nr:hypothetical protein COCON_G00112390 [Conger conger]